MPAQSADRVWAISPTAFAKTVPGLVEFPVLQKIPVWAIITQVEDCRRAGCRERKKVMLDINMLRKTPDVVRENIKKKFQDDKLPLVDEVI